MGPYVSLKVYQSLSVLMGSHGPFGFLLVFMVLIGRSGSVWFFMGPYRSLCVLMSPSGSLLVLMVSLLVLRGLYES